MAERSVGASIAHGIAAGSRWTSRQIRGEVVRRVGGAARARVIVLFGLVLALNGADTATIGAVAPELEKSSASASAQIGLLSSVTLLVGAVATLPVGMLVDRTKRIPMLSVSIVLWSFASLLSALCRQLLDAAADPPAAGRRGRHRRPRDRVADRRLLPRSRARPHLRLHPRRRDRRQRGRLHRLAATSRARSTGARRSCCWRSRGSSWRASCSGRCPSRCAAARATWSRAPRTWSRRRPCRARGPRAGAVGLARGRGARHQAEDLAQQAARATGARAGSEARADRGPHGRSAWRRRCATRSRSRPT